jgi:hypothetical protein
MHQSGCSSNYRFGLQMADLFDSGPNQLGLDLGDSETSRSYEPDRSEIRSELIAVLETARAAVKEVPWDERTRRYHKVVFPQMARWLRDDERDQLCFEFAREIERLELLIAA